MAIVSNIWSTSLIDINGSNKILKTPLTITQYDSPAPHATASKSTIKLNQQLTAYST